jgi:hypothetical protein
MARLPHRQLHRIRTGVHERLDHLPHILDPLKKSRLIEKSMIHRHIETSIGARIEETIKTIGLHKVTRSCGKVDAMKT